ncbi:MAG: type II secretion system F family protein [Deltaproteobacteria bacterium]|nr:type II secretion system F family protein [Deltaproteobacteria bacterium]
MDFFGSIFFVSAAAFLIAKDIFVHIERWSSWMRVVSKRCRPLLRWCRRRARREAMIASLPLLMDWLTISVEAGLDVVASLERILARATLGPLGEEMQTVLQEVQWGSRFSEACQHLAVRVKIPAIASFAASLANADRLGTPLGTVLRIHAEQLRIDRFARAERAGIIASQKLLLPLVFFIMPATFIMIFSPLVIRWLTGGVEALL